MADYVYRGTRFDADEPLTKGAYDPSKCGSSAGYEQHRRYNTDICTPCRDAKNEARRAQDARRKATRRKVTRGTGFNPDKCGTEPGYQHHKYWRIPSCPACRTAHTKHRRKERQTAMKGNK